MSKDNEAVLIDDNKSKASSKVETEKRILNDVISYCTKMGGAVGGAAAKMAIDQIDASGERPDLRIRTSRGVAIGLEHFRVDRLIGYGKKAESRAAQLSSRLEKERQDLLRMPRGTDQDNKMIDVLGKYAAELTRYLADSVPDDLCKSLEKRLFDEDSGHALKLSAYREELVNEGAEKVELGFLIEVHSDFSEFFLNSGGVAKKIVCGEPLLSSQTFDLLERVARQVDWILLGFYPNIGETLIKAAVIDCRRDQFAANCCKQGLSRVNLLYVKKERLKHSYRYEGSSSNPLGDYHSITLSRKVNSPDIGLTWRQCLSGTAEALNLERSGAPFAATKPIQALYETVALSSKKFKGPFSAEKVLRIMNGMPREEMYGRFKAFETRHG